jgi:hypothetical protein
MDRTRCAAALNSRGRAGHERLPPPVSTVAFRPLLRKARWPLQPASQPAKYSPAGTPIEVEADRVGTSDWARVVVRDHGIGVEDDALEAIFAGQRTARAPSRRRPARVSACA